MDFINTLLFSLYFQNEDEIEYGERFKSAFSGPSAELTANDIDKVAKMYEQQNTQSRGNAFGLFLKSTLNCCLFLQCI